MFCLCTLKRRDFLKLGTTALATGLLAGCGKSPESSTPPHIVLIVADGMGWGDIGCYTPSSSIPTSHLDRLAAEGIRFTDAHASASEGTSSRYGILTGRYGFRSSHTFGTLDGDAPAVIEPDRLTLASLLKQAGYATVGIGTWQLGLGSEDHTDYTRPFHPAPTDYGFDSYFGIPSSLDRPPYLYIENDHAVAAPSDEMPESSPPARYAAGPAAPEFDHRDALPTLTGKAVSSLDTHTSSSPGTPLFLYVALTGPNSPWMPSLAFEGKSGAGPAGDMVMQTDDAVGQILTAIDRNGMTDNTLVIVTSATGADERFLDPSYAHDPNGPWRGQRGDNWEGGHRVPLLMRWPDHITAGTESAEIVCLTDLFATFAGITGQPIPDDAGEDSFDLAPVLKGEPLETPLRPYTVHMSYSGLPAIRTNEWKIIAHQGSGGYDYDSLKDNLRLDQAKGQLYNLAEDPREENNQYDAQLMIISRMIPYIAQTRSDGRSRPVESPAP